MLTVQSFTFNPLQENTYVVYNEKGECCIIDPGCYFAGEEKELREFIEDNQLKPVLLINTHCHLDHILGNQFISQQYGLPLHLHRLEDAVLAMGPATGQLWGLSFVNYEGEKKYLDEGDHLRLGDDVFEILFTPGHSPGSISLVNRENKFVISGDVLFQGSIGRTDLPGGDFTLLEESIKTKLYTLPADTIIYSGHGGSTTVGDEMKDNPFVKMI